MSSFDLLTTPPSPAAVRGGRRPRLRAVAPVRSRRGAGRLGVVLALAMAARTLPAYAQGAAASPPTTAALVAREIAALELVGGGTPLTRDEQVQAEEAVASAMRANPEAWLRSEATWTEPLQRARGDRAYAAALRRTVRLGVELASPPPAGLEHAYAIEREIIHAHDPTVVFDRARGHLMTEASVRDLAIASSWFAARFGLPAPSAEAARHLSDWLEASYTGTDDHLAGALASAAEHAPFAARAFAGIDAKRREAAIGKLRGPFQAAEAPARDVMLAVAAAVFAELAAQQARAPAGLPVDRYMEIMRTVVLGSTVVHGLNQNGPHSRR
jgi:hypothetical protein